MQIRLKSDPGDGGKKVKVKVKSPTPTPAELEAANKLARDISVRRGLMQGENLNVGGQIPKFYDANSGKELLAGAVTPETGRLATKVPLYVKELEWDAKAGLPYYIDEKTGDTQFVNKDLFYSPRFRKATPATSILKTIASR